MFKLKQQKYSLTGGYALHKIKRPLVSILSRNIKNMRNITNKMI